MIHRLRFFCVFSAVLLFAISCTGCAMSRKAQTLRILQQCEPEIQSLNVDSAAINPELFKKIGKGAAKSLFPNPQVVLFAQNIARGIIENPLGELFVSVKVNVKNHAKDTLWLRGMQADLHLDTLMTLPLTGGDSAMLLPGDNDITLHTHLTVDQKIFSLPGVKSIRVKGILRAALAADGDTVGISFDKSREITREDMNTIFDRARTEILNDLADKWIGKIKL
jgi:hypothetical protein